MLSVSYGHSELQKQLLCLKIWSPNIVLASAHQAQLYFIFLRKTFKKKDFFFEIQRIKLYISIRIRSHLVNSDPDDGSEIIWIWISMDIARLCSVRKFTSGRERGQGKKKEHGSPKTNNACMRAHHLDNSQFDQLRCLTASFESRYYLLISRSDLKMFSISGFELRLLCVQEVVTHFIQ